MSNFNDGNMALTKGFEPPTLGSEDRGNDQNTGSTKPDDATVLPHPSGTEDAEETRQVKAALAKDVSHYRGRPIQEFLDFDADATCDGFTKTCCSEKIVRSAKLHWGFVPMTGEFREVPAGTLMLLERAKIDGEWRSVRTALDDIDDYLKWEEQQNG